MFFYYFLNCLFLATKILVFQTAFFSILEDVENKLNTDLDYFSKWAGKMWWSESVKFYKH